MGAVRDVPLMLASECQTRIMPLFCCSAACLPNSLSVCHYLFQYENELEKMRMEGLKEHGALKRKYAKQRRTGVGALACQHVPLHAALAMAYWLCSCRADCES